jgi:hypothetical protein
MMVRNTVMLTQELTVQSSAVAYSLVLLEVVNDDSSARASMLVHI